MIHWASQRPAVIWAFAVALVMAGAVAFTKLPLATKTTVELPKLRIATAWSGASAELIEAYITSPVEAAIQPVRGVRRTSSESGDRGSQITVELDPKGGEEVQKTFAQMHRDSVRDLVKDPLVGGRERCTLR